jgi:hypothetical protein
MRAAPPMADYRTKTSLLSTATALVPQQFDKIVHRALRDLALAKDPAELVRIADIADALRFCAKRARLGLAAQNKAAAVRLWAERGIGEILAKTARHAGGRPSMKPVLVENGFSPAAFGSLASIESCRLARSAWRKYQNRALRDGLKTHNNGNLKSIRVTF